MTELSRYDLNAFPTQFFNAVEAREFRQHRTFFCASEESSILYDYVEPGYLNGDFNETTYPGKAEIYRNMRDFAAHLLCLKAYPNSLERDLRSQKAKEYLNEIGKKHIFIGTMIIALIQDAKKFESRIEPPKNLDFRLLFRAVGRPTMPRNLVSLFVLYELECQGVDVKSNVAMISDMIKECIDAQEAM